LKKRKDPKMAERDRFHGIIAIDGPAASGKSTLARRLASELGFLYFDTGVMYRAVTLEALVRKVGIKDEQAVTKLANDLDIDVLADMDSRLGYKVLVNGKDVTERLRETQVDKNVSAVSAYPGVRRAMTARQRQIGMRGAVVMVGRDIGTVVLPDADLKIYVDASVEARASRRHAELLEAGSEPPYSKILNELKRRDEIDSGREVAPLMKADDAVVLDNSSLSIEETLDHALRILRERVSEER
jgi:cytidylate kinase